MEVSIWGLGCIYHKPLNQERAERIEAPSPPPPQRLCPARKIACSQSAALVPYIEAEQGDPVALTTTRFSLFLPALDR